MPISNSLALLDSNILVYANQQADEHHQVAFALRERGKRGEIPVCITPQVLNEFFAVVTSSGRGGVTNPITPAAALAEVEKYHQAELIRKIYPTATTFDRMCELLRAYQPGGRRIFDLYLVATMLDNNVTKIYTFNTRHFRHITEIEVLDPEEIDSSVPEEAEEPESAESEDTESTQEQ